MTIGLRFRRSHDFEPLEPRRLFCGEHLDPALIEWLNSLPDDSPIPFDAERFGGHGTDDPAPGFVAAPETAVTTIVNNGPTTNRIDLVIVGDGYTDADLPTYSTHAQNVVDNFFNESPLDSYLPLFNIHRVDVVSNQSGVDNDPTQGIFRDTALDMAFFCNGTERLLCVNTSKAAMFAALAPQVDQILAIGNSTKYGGAGYGSQNLGTFAGGNGSALEIARHEFGHSFADLADEYEYGGPVNYAGGEPATTNLSTFQSPTMLAQQRKWWRWLDSPGVGTFEGGGYSETGIYRPTFDSKMRNLFRPWEQVNSEQLIISLYRTVRPIDNGTALGAHGVNESFFVDPIDPIGHTLDVQWFVDNQLVAGATDTTFDAATLGLTSGLHTLRATVVDNTPLVRDPTARNNLLTQSRSWTLDAAPPVASSGLIRVDDNPLSVRVTFDDDVSASLSAGDLSLFNLTTGAPIPAAAQAVTFTQGLNNARFTFPGLDGSRLPDGNYTATLPAGSVSDAVGNALPADYSFSFFFLNGDATRDRAVNIADFAILSGNFNRPGSFQMGDFNYSGTVEIGDFSVLAANFNTTLPVPSAAEVPAPSDVPRLAAMSAASVSAPDFFSQRMIEELNDLHEPRA